MLCAGDELGNSQGGNNNAYCQDNPTTWLNWDEADGRLTELVSQLLALRAAEPLLRYPRWFASGPGEPGIAWYGPSGHEMTPSDWHDAGQRAFGAQLREAGASVPRLMIVFNPDASPLPFLLCNGPWRLVLDSSGESAAPLVLPGQPLNVPARSLLVLRHAPT
jgi:glycogen operon protein